MAESVGQECSRRQARRLWKVWLRGIEKPEGERIAEGRFQGLRKRAGTRSSRSNCTSSKEVAIPYQPGMAAVSQRWT
jgi:hypothetical protein